LKLIKRKNGYLQVILCKNGKIRNFRVHRLVAEAFIPNPENLPQVDHLNGDRADNRVANLQWISKIENNRKRQSGIAIPRRVQCIETGEIFETATDAAKAVNRSKITMSQHLSGKTKTCAGKHFKYYNEDVINSDANLLLF
jgi:hypothetical protein